MGIGASSEVRPALRVEDGRVLDPSGVGGDIDGALLAGDGFAGARRFASTGSLPVLGEVRPDSTTADMIFGVHDVVCYLSPFMALEPGDLVNTGTPAGGSLGHGHIPHPRGGDVVEFEADGFGRQASSVRQA